MSVIVVMSPCTVHRGRTVAEELTGGTQAYSQIWISLWNTQSLSLGVSAQVQRQINRF